MMGWRLGVCFTATMVLSAWADGQAAPASKPRAAESRQAEGPIDPHRSLLITDPAVMADPERTVDPCDGSAKLPVWSFGHLMSEMVAQRPDLTAQQFARQWLTLFGTPQTVNGQTVAPRNVDAVTPVTSSRSTRAPAATVVKRTRASSTSTRAPAGCPIF